MATSFLDPPPLQPAPQLAVGWAHDAPLVPPEPGKLHARVLRALHVAAVTGSAVSLDFQVMQPLESATAAAAIADAGACIAGVR
jgi:hypothetical protein